MDPVIIVGAGPVGLTLALALARQEVPCVVLDEGPGKDEPRAARTVVLREDTAALMERLTGVPLDRAGAHWAGWRSVRRKQVMREVVFDGEAEPAPLHIAQHVLTDALRAALSGERLVKVAVDSRLDAIEQESSGVTAHTRGPKGTWWRGSYLVGCDGPRSTVRKLQDIRFPGRTAVERHAVAALRTELPWYDEALLHRMPPWRMSGPSAGEVTARPLPDGVWRLDWLLPPGKDLVTPELLVTRIRETLAGWARRHDPAVRAPGHRRPHRPPPAGPPLARRPRLPRRGRGPPARRAGHARPGRGAAGRRQPRLEAGPGLAPRAARGAARQLPDRTARGRRRPAARRRPGAAAAARRRRAARLRPRLDPGPRLAPHGRSPGARPAGRAGGVRRLAARARGTWRERPRSTHRPERRSPMYGSPRRTAPSCSCGTGSAAARCSWC